MSISDPIQRDVLLELYLEYHGIFLGYATRLLNDSHAAEDIVHAVFEKIIEKPHMLKYDTAKNNRAYVFAMVHNHCIKHLERNKKLQPLEGMELAEDTDFTSLLETRESYMAALQTTMDLPENYRNVIMMRYSFDMNDDEISEHLKISPVNVRVRVCRAVAALKKAIKAGEARA